MSSFKPMDSKREEFRKYLEKTGVMDAVTKVLVALYEEPERPEDALLYVQTRLGAGNSEDSELVKELRKEIDNLKNELAGVKEKIANGQAGANDADEKVNLRNSEGIGKGEESQNAFEPEDVGKPDDLGKDDGIDKADGVLKAEGPETGEPVPTETAEKVAPFIENGAQADVPSREEGKKLCGGY